MKIIGFLVIALLILLVLYVSWRYITSKKYLKNVPKAKFFGGPINDEDVVMGSFTDRVFISVPSWVDEARYAVYEHGNNGFYFYLGDYWESEVDLDNSEILRYDVGNSDKQEESDDSASHHSGCSD
jgi:hypothetical protein